MSQDIFGLVWPLIFEISKIIQKFKEVTSPSKTATEHHFVTISDEIFFLCFLLTVKTDREFYGETIK